MDQLAAPNKPPQGTVPICLYQWEIGPSFSSVFSTYGARTQYKLAEDVMPGSGSDVGGVV